MENIINELANIDYNFWKEQNPYYGNKPLNPSMRGAFTLITNKGFLTQYKGFNSCGELVSVIDENINQLKTDLKNDSLLLDTFDLIQVWGGRTGRRPYTVTSNRGYSYRSKFSDWIEFYRSGVKEALDGKHILSLKLLCNIGGIQTSFATKHLKFWGGFPIQDTRMNLLFNPQNKGNISYDKFLEALNLIKTRIEPDLSILDIEKALFAFSQNYFPNNSLDIKLNPQHSLNNDIAMTLAYISKQGG